MALSLARAGDRGLVECFRRRALEFGAATLLLGIPALTAASWKAPALSHRLTTAALPIVVLGLAACGVSLLALARRRYALARGTSLAVGVTVIWGWIVAQAPHLIGTALTVRTAAATSAELTAVAIAAGVVLVAVVPAICLLFRLSTRPLTEVSE